MPASEARALAPSPLSHVRGLAEFHAGRTAPPFAPLTRLDRVLLDMLGLGLEQTLDHLRDFPDLADFEAWILDTAGAPDPDALDRYHALRDGLPPPPATAARLAAIDAAPPVFDAADLAQWEEQGYVVLRNAITPAEAEAAAAFLWQATGADPADPDSWYVAERCGIMVQLFQHPSLEAARRSPRVHKAFAQLWGSADLWPIVDRMSLNPPDLPGRRFQGPNLHWDVSLARPIPFATQGILYLNDVTPDQGALTLVPGFHYRIDAWLDGLGDADPRTVDLSAETIGIGANAGDLVLWRQDLPHGASPNRTPRPRLAQYVNFYPAWLTDHPEWR